MRLSHSRAPCVIKLRVRPRLARLFLQGRGITQVLDYSHNPWLVAASLAVALMAGFTGLSLTRGASHLDEGRRKLVVALAAVVLERTRRAGSLALWVTTSRALHGDAAIAAARIRGAPRSFELKVAAFLIVAQSFAHQQGAAITELRIVLPKLMARIDLRYRHCPGRRGAAGKYRGQFGFIAAAYAHVVGQCSVKGNQFRRGCRCGVKPAVKPCRQLLIAIVKWDYERVLGHTVLI